MLCNLGSCCKFYVVRSICCALRFTFSQAMSMISIVILNAHNLSSASSFSPEGG